MNGSIGSIDDIDDCDNINVVVRVRPISDKERKRSDHSIISFPGEGQLLLENGALNGRNKQFRFNVLFEHEASQDDVMNHSGAKRMVDMAVAGYPCTIFCYGQTGSGKTHTLTGPPQLFNMVPDMYSSDHGLMFRSFVYLFQVITDQKEKNFLLKASYLEIYNEKVIDLLNPVAQESGRKPRSLMVRWSRKKRAFFVENLFTVECEELDDLLAVLEEGLRNRAVASHNMNEFSSRSHTILTVYITSEQKAAEDSDVYISKLGKINFVDLAGSEMTKKTNSEGKTLEEANNINKSLMVLGTCIANLSDSKKRTGHIPYRDSKLTKLLADSLAGSGVTLMIACISPAHSNMNETLNTLRYAARAKKIKTKPIIVMDPRESMIVSLKREVNILRQENDQLKSLLDIGAHGTTMKSSEKSAENHMKNKLTVSKGKLQELKAAELIDLLQEYMQDNEDLRQENADMHMLRDAQLRDQEHVIKENERLLRKIEESKLSSNLSTSGEPALSEKTRNSEGRRDSVNVWTNPMHEKHEKKLKKTNSKTIPDHITKQLDKQQFIGTGDIKKRLAERNGFTGSRSAESQEGRTQRKKSADRSTPKPKNKSLSKDTPNRNRTKHAGSTSN